jgi:hypothetical protein
MFGSERFTEANEGNEEENAAPKSFAIAKARTRQAGPTRNIPKSVRPFPLSRLESIPKTPQANNCPPDTRRGF